MAKFATAFLSSVSASNLGSCGLDSPSKVEDCQNVDFGSCGNACCKLDFKITGTTMEVVDKLNTTLASERMTTNYYYWPQMTAEGTTGFANLTMMGSPMGFDYIGQVTHTTSGPGHYVDYINFNIKAADDEMSAHSTVRAHSISGIGGALSDNGQNYKNIMMAMKATFGDDVQAISVDGSCLPPAEGPPSLAMGAHPHSAVTPVPITVPEIIVGTCGLDSPSKVEDCQNVDFGSCGGACCKLDIQVVGTTKETVEKLNSTMSLASFGPDGYYWPQATAEGALGFADLTVMGSPMGFDYIGQVTHTTSGPGHYVDYINFNIKSSTDGTHSVIRAHSISHIGGALADNGQNYKNIMTAVKAAFGQNFEVSSVDGSCPSSSLVV